MAAAILMAAELPWWSGDTQSCGTGSWLPRDAEPQAAKGTGLWCGVNSQKFPSLQRGVTLQRTSFFLRGACTGQDSTNNMHEAQSQPELTEGIQVSEDGKQTGTASPSRDVSLPTPRKRPVLPPPDRQDATARRLRAGAGLTPATSGSTATR